MSELPEGWRPSTLGEVALILDSRRVPLNARERDARRGPFPYYGANGQVGTIDDYLFEGDHILLAEDGGYFDDPHRPNAYAVSGQFWVNNHAHILQATGAVEQRYLLHLVNATDLMPYVSGTTRLKLTQADMRRIPVPLPPLAEQRRIVARIEALFARTRRARADLERIAPLSERLWCGALSTEFDPTTAEKVITLGELVVEGPQNGYSPATSADSKGTLALRLTATTSGNLDLSPKAVKRLSEIVPPGSRYWLRPGDLLIQRANALEHIGAAAIYHGPSDTYIYPDLMMRVRLNSTHLTEYLWRYLNSPAARQHFRERATGTAGNMPKINSAVVRSLPVPMVAPDQLMAAVKKLFATERSKEILRRESKRASTLLDRLEQTILALAFRGELVPQNPTDIVQAAPNVEHETTSNPRKARRAAA